MRNSKPAKAGWILLRFFLPPPEKFECEKIRIYC